MFILLKIYIVVELALFMFTYSSLVVFSTEYTRSVAIAFLILFGVFL